MDKVDEPIDDLLDQIEHELREVGSAGLREIIDRALACEPLPVGSPEGGSR